ncbi:MAG TPA: YceI family protein [Kofleriaceae bacterium]|jgi:polyisoprenoid-binding protein YceI
MKTLKLLVLASMLAAAPACKKKEEPQPAPAPAGSGSAATPAPAPAGSGSAAVAPAPAGSGSAAAAAPVDPNADFVSVFARHTEGKPIDPVEVHFDRFKVTKSSIDPKKVEGGTLSLEIDTTSVRTDSAKRDAHLQTPDFIDAAKFATITIDIDNVKKKQDNTYTADATVKFRDLTKKYPVTFDVVETKDDSIRIKGEQQFSRLDFNVGKDSTDPKEAPVAKDLVFKIQLTLKKT